MRLKREQKKAVLKWIAEGLENGELNDLASSFVDPFSVSRQQVDYYRRTRKVELSELQRADEYDAMNSGLALKEVRVDRLQKLAALMEADLFGGFLWLDDVKGVGAGAAAQVVDYEVFNRGEVETYRGLLDDIAKETGGRVQRQDITSAGEAIQVVSVGIDVDKL